MTLFLIIAITFFASLFRSTLGFGESLFAVPLLLLFLPAEVAVPLSVMVSMVIALIIILQDHRKIHFQSAKWLIIYSVLGIPLGIFILIYANETLVKTGLGFLIVIYSLYSLFAKKILTLNQDSKVWLFICGFISGVFGGAYGLNGPPLVLYGSMRKWTAKHFRATLQAYFLPVNFLSIVGYSIKGLVTMEVSRYFLFSLIAVIPAIYLGRYFNNRLKDDSFFKYAYMGLAGIGVILIVNALST